MVGFLLDQNYPNPFSEKTSIKYTIPKTGRVILRVYDFAGRPVTTLVNSKQSAGTYTVDFLASYYFDTHFYYTIYLDKYFLTKKMLMLNK